MLLIGLLGETLHWYAVHDLLGFGSKVGSGNLRFYSYSIMVVPWLSSALSAVRIVHCLIVVDALWCSEHSSRVCLLVLEACLVRRSHFLYRLHCGRRYSAGLFRERLPARYLALLIALLSLDPQPYQGKCSRIPDKRRPWCSLTRYCPQRF